MYLHWKQNGRDRIWDLSEKNITRKLRKALRKAVEPGGIEDSLLMKATNVADMHHAIYYRIGENEFQHFEIRSTK